MGKTTAEVKSETILIDIETIDVNLRPASQMRVKLDAEALERYAEELDQLPPPQLMFDPSSNIYWVIDGAHTINAAWGIGRHEIEAEIQEGSFLDALRLACRANSKRGVPLTKGDKSHRVKEVLKMPMVGDWKLEEIAELCNVSFQLVSKLDDREVFHGGKPQSSGGNGKPNKGGRPRKPKAAPGTPPKPPDPAIQAAEGWSRVLNNHLNLIRSFEKAGGVVSLTEGWARDRKEMLIDTLRLTMREMGQLADQLEEVLGCGSN